MTPAAPPRDRHSRLAAPPALALALAVALGLALGLLPTPASACRYNVRDVGFVDLETAPYRLLAFLDSPPPPDRLQHLQEAASEVLANAPVAFEVLSTAEHPGHPALAHRTAAATDTAPRPALVLVPPDGPNRPLALPFDPAGTPAALREQLLAAVASPLRDTLVAEASRAFGVILLIEGTQADANAEARRTIAAAIDQVRGHMKTLPKAIAEPPALVVLEAAQLLRESVLLWTLRQDTRPTPEPRAAIIYGRARWIGPVMHGAEISTRNLVGVFSLVGADCECGLDLAWTQGTRVPVRWPESLHAPLARALGFDPENPVVKTEISGIVNRRGSGAPPDRSASEASTAPTASTPSDSPVPTTPRTAAPAPPSPGPPPRAARLLFGLGSGLAVVVLALGVALAWRASRRD